MIKSSTFHEFWLILIRIDLSTKNSAPPPRTTAITVGIAQFIVGDSPSGGATGTSGGLCSKMAISEQSCSVVPSLSHSAKSSGGRDSCAKAVYANLLQLQIRQ